MIYPNALAANFCNWILNISEQKTTTPQKIIVNAVYSAALAGDSVSDQTWHNFNLFTAWRFKFYQEWQAMQPSIPLESTNVFLNNWLQRLAAALAVPPSLALLNRLNFALDFAQKNNIIQFCDFIFNAVCDDVSQLLIPIISSSGHNCTASASLSFTPNVGVSSLANSYINSNLNFSTDFNFCSQNDICISHAANNLTRSGQAAYGVGSSAVNGEWSIIDWYTDYFTYNWLGEAGAMNTYLYSNSHSICSSRLAANRFNFQIGDTLLNFGGIASVAFPNYDFKLLAKAYDGSVNSYFYGNLQALIICPASVDQVALESFKQLLINVN